MPNVRISIGNQGVRQFKFMKLPYRVSYGLCQQILAGARQEPKSRKLPNAIRSPTSQRLTMQLAGMENTITASSKPNTTDFPLGQECV